MSIRARIESLADRVLELVAPLSPAARAQRREVDELRRRLCGVSGVAIRKPFGTYTECGICEATWWRSHAEHKNWCPLNPNSAPRQTPSLLRRVA